MKDQKTDANQFSDDARAWLHQFLDSNYFYQAGDITPYMHVLVYHVPEMMRIHQKFGLAAFSYGGVRKGRKSAIVNILEYENRVLYFNNHNMVDLIRLSKRLRIK
ncbi:hypothetical protein GLOIN_2v1786003 [Rhizophagus irregularis DAOM 181602=DAOM 197198]|nr:hypothetical protein GLOIN_2v1786003 [Rhizophagus irregularis DAOM 181602=DAOM 197198]